MNRNAGTPEDFMTRLCHAVLKPDLLVEDATRRLIGRAIADTVAVAAAGFLEPAARNALAAYEGQGAVTWSGEQCESLEAAVLINGTASHALDFDDVYVESMTHISTVLLPTVLRDGRDDPETVLTAFAAGLVAARAVARRVGRGHYNLGWHGTGTIGALASAAAAGRLEGLDADQMSNAFALAASMSGGLQANFSTQAKPAHAGFAAVAGTRAARLAKAGMTGSRAVFETRGYPDLYGAGDGDIDPPDEAFEARPDQISVKLFPCCYATHRLIGLALDARAALGDKLLDPTLRFEFSVPAGSIAILRFDKPDNGLEARFSKTYPAAVALLRGTPTLPDFYDAALHEPDIVAMMQRISVQEDQAQPSQGDIEFGQACLAITRADAAVSQFTRAALPGSPIDPPSPQALRDKIGGCLTVFESWTGQRLPILSRMSGLATEAWIPASYISSDEKSYGVKS
ncbi:MmgE/PrpD family protein [Devosia sp.]|uniref:MmgE/PrpD family protein n=1 Tax=Devosia sp. TaxID=1871048 RepID=UPI0027357937|nr:MmgE/PrpD family protein [Devosia sp.]MDP2780070.1 MmgE/PrpD family protein [Devosia sp.]